MSDSSVDFAIIGSTPLARLVAGLLTSVHGKSTLFIGESQAGYRLPRGMDLSVAPITRPQTWALLRTVLPETLKLLTRIGGRSVWSRVDPIMFAQHPAGREAMAHVGSMATAFGHGVEPVGERTLGAGRNGLVLRDAILLHRPLLETALDRWLDAVGVRRPADGATLGIGPDGQGELLDGEDRISIGQTVLADDRAVLHHLSDHSWPALLQRQVASTIFSEPTRPLAAPVLLQLDQGLILSQRPGRGVVAIGPGPIEPLAAQLGVLLGQQLEFRQAGQSSYDTMGTRDAAPAVGRIGGTGPDVLTGLGPTGAFLAPAVARWLAGVATEMENAWFGARLVDRSVTSSSVAEFGFGP